MFLTQIKHAQIKINLLSFWTVWQVGTTNRVILPARQARNKFLGSLKGLPIRALAKWWYTPCNSLWRPNYSSNLLTNLAFAYASLYSTYLCQCTNMPLTNALAPCIYRSFRLRMESSFFSFRKGYFLNYILNVAHPQSTLEEFAWVTKGHK